MTERHTADVHLRQLAELLDFELRVRLTALVDADSDAARTLELEQQAQRDRDLAVELRRQLHAAIRRADRLAEADVRLARITATLAAHFGAWDGTPLHLNELLARALR